MFLEKRDSRELERNGLVSIFLRGESAYALQLGFESDVIANALAVLEYFSGSASLASPTGCAELTGY